MDSGPFSTPQPQDRRATTSRPPEPTHRSVPQQTEEPVRAVRRAPEHHREPQHEPKNGFKKFIIPLAIALVVIALGVCMWMFMSRSHDTLGKSINSKEYQAVFLMNGQVYFGKLTDLNSGYLKMTDVWYLQADDTKQQTETTGLQETVASGNDVKLVKLGSEIHGPQDEMMISRDQVLLVENLRDDGKVSSAIKEATSRSN